MLNVTVEHLNKIEVEKETKQKLISPLDIKSEDSFSDVDIKINGKVPLEVPTYADIVRMGNDDHKQNTQQEINNTKAFNNTH